MCEAATLVPRTALASRLAQRNIRDGSIALRASYAPTCAYGLRFAVSTPHMNEREKERKYIEICSRNDQKLISVLRCHLPNKVSERDNYGAHSGRWCPISTRG
jgi:hypothetical protein